MFRLCCFCVIIFFIFIYIGYFRVFLTRHYCTAPVSFVKLAHCKWRDDDDDENLVVIQMELGRSKSNAAGALDELVSKQPMCISNLRQYVTSSQLNDVATPWTVARCSCSPRTVSDAPPVEYLPPLSHMNSASTLVVEYRYSRRNRAEIIKHAKTLHLDSC